MDQTLGSFLTAGFRITAYCEAEGCNHSADLDLEAMISRLGPDFPALRDPLSQHLVCSVCGKKQMGVLIRPPQRPKDG